MFTVGYIVVQDEEGDDMGTDYHTNRAYDWLEADDPALFSDEFSESEDFTEIS